MSARTPGRRRRLAVAVTAAVVLHAALGVAVGSSPAPAPRPLPEVTRVEVETFSREVRLPKPRAPERPPETPPPPKPREVPPPKVADPAPVAAQPVTKVAAAEPRRARPKPKTAQKATPRPGPKTVALKNVTLRGTVQVHGGDEDVFGSPTVPATPDSTAPDPDAPRTGPREGRTGGGAPEARVAAAPVVVPPRVIERIRGAFPSDAPRLGRPVPIALSLRIDAEGRVASARVVSRPRAAGRAFDAEARRLARQHRFDPATRDGVPIPFTIRYVVEFAP